MTACIAYMGYAAGGLLLAFMANARAAASGTGAVDIAAAGADFKMQFMFVVAFRQHRRHILDRPEVAGKSDCTRGRLPPLLVR